MLDDGHPLLEDGVRADGVLARHVLERRPVAGEKPLVVGVDEADERRVDVEQRPRERRQPVERVVERRRNRRVPVERRQPNALVRGQRVRRLAQERQAVLDERRQLVVCVRHVLQEVLRNYVAERCRVDLVERRRREQDTGRVGGLLTHRAHEVEPRPVRQVVLRHHALRRGVGVVQRRLRPANRRGLVRLEAGVRERRGRPGARGVVGVDAENHYVPISHDRRKFSDSRRPPGVVTRGLTNELIPPRSIIRL